MSDRWKITTTSRLFAVLAAAIAGRGLCTESVEPLGFAADTEVSTVIGRPIAYFRGPPFDLARHIRQGNSDNFQDIIPIHENCGNVGLEDDARCAR